MLLTFSVPVVQLRFCLGPVFVYNFRVNACSLDFDNVNHFLRVLVKKKRGR